MPRADNANPRYSDVARETVSSSYVRVQQPGTTLRADIETLMRDDGDARITAVTKVGLHNAALSAALPDRWHRTAVFGHDVKHVWGLVEGSFGFNLDVVVDLTDSSLQHYYHDGEGWHEGVLIDV